MTPRTVRKIAWAVTGWGAFLVHGSLGWYLIASATGHGVPSDPLLTTCILGIVFLFASAVIHANASDRE